MKKRYLCILFPALIFSLGLSGCRTQSAGKTQGESRENGTPSSIALTAEAIKTVGVKVTETEYKALVEQITIPGEIRFNPKRRCHVTSRSAGRVELLLSYPGERIQQGQILLTLYSQDFLGLQAELLQSIRRINRHPTDPKEIALAQSFLDSVRSKLRLLGLFEAEIGQIEQSGSMKSLLPVRAPLSGTVIESSVTTGDFVELGASLFKIADLSTVWVVLHLHEKDLVNVRTGLEVSVHTTAIPDRDFRGRIFQIGSTVDEQTRTVEGLIEIGNPGGQLRQGMYVEAVVDLPRAKKSFLIPTSSLQDFQNKKIVFVQAGENVFSTREVETGISLAGWTEIKKGIKERERVASSGTFFLKSELFKNLLGEE